MHGQLAAHSQCPLMHRLQAKTALTIFIVYKTDPIIDHFHQKIFILIGHLHLPNTYTNMVGCRVFAHIGQRLLQNTNQLYLGQWSQIKRAIYFIIKLRDNASLNTKFIEIFINCWNQPLFTGQCCPQTEDVFPYIGVRHLNCLAHLLQFNTEGILFAAVEQCFQSLNLQI